MWKDWMGCFVAFNNLSLPLGKGENRKMNLFGSCIILYIEEEMRP